MNAPNRNTLWAQIFVDELARSGLQAVCIAPGSRSTPLTIAFAAEPRIQVYSHLDERSAAFFALGLALAGRKPVALVCTSGTAAANFYPAVIEAHQAQVPLLLLTADRPHELRHSGANQTIDQVKLYGDQVRWFVDVALPEANPPASSLRSLRTLAGRTMAVAAGSPPGPVHLNFPFRKPLEPIPVPGDQPGPAAGETAEALAGRPAQQPYTRFSRGTVAPSEGQIDSLVAAIRAVARGLIICGPRCPAGAFPQAVTRLARLTGYPILADPLSGLRFGPHLEQVNGLILGGYENFLPGWRDRGWSTPQLILRFGAMPTGKAIGDYLESVAECRQFAVDGHGLWADATHQLTDFMWADPEITCQQLADQLEVSQVPTTDSGWATVFRQAEQACWATIELARSETLFEGGILVDVVELLPPEAILYVASSMPVRHLDQFGRPGSTPLCVLANRGASGIDGTISSALGAAAATAASLVLVTGDLAFYHDLNGLLALRRCGVKATIVLINNDGGGIFHRLPIAQFDPPFTDLFLTPHGLDFEPAIRMFGADYIRVTTQADFRDALRQSIGGTTSCIIEVPSDSARYEQLRREIMARVAAQLKHDN
jgi:2-succinyl-5-enolpyruvyl-6-hydroxy-3-cyclohexene-1-carboxylate synthase